MAQVTRLLAVAHPTWHNLVPTGAVPVSAVPDHLLLESGDVLLLESGEYILLEAD